jgi:hypothetical protein
MTFPLLPVVFGCSEMPWSILVWNLGYRSDQVSSGVFHVVLDQKLLKNRGWYDCILYRNIRSNEDTIVLQDDLNKLADWEQKWGMDFHPDKCSTLHVTRSKAPILQAFHYYLLCSVAQKCLDPSLYGISDTVVIKFLQESFMWYSIKSFWKIQSRIRLFADDCIIYRNIRSNEDTIVLQDDLNKLADWEQKWGMDFHPDKPVVFGYSEMPWSILVWNLGYRSDQVSSGVFHVVLDQKLLKNRGW